VITKHTAEVGNRDQVKTTLGNAFFVFAQIRYKTDFLRQITLITY